MANENRVLIRSFIAEEDLSSYQYHFIALSSTEDYVRLMDSTSEVACGILQNAPEAGEAASVMIEGISKLVAGSALDIGNIVASEYVSATDNGKGDYVTIDNDNKRALVLKGVSAEDSLCTVHLKW